jgi:hypothetical protein
MKGLSLACSVSVLLAASAVHAQQLGRVEQPAPAATASGATTPDMWYYEQAQREYNNPKLAVRHKAEVEAALRQQRIAARDWYGVSNSRPIANPTPSHGTYSPRFISNSRNPFLWNNSATGTMVR